MASRKPHSTRVVSGVSAQGNDDTKYRGKANPTTDSTLSSPPRTSRRDPEPGGEGLVEGRRRGPPLVPEVGGDVDGGREQVAGEPEVERRRAHRELVPVQDRGQQLGRREQGGGHHEHPDHLPPAGQHGHHEGRRHRGVERPEGGGHHHRLDRPGEVLGGVGGGDAHAQHREDAEEHLGPQPHPEGPGHGGCRVGSPRPPQLGSSPAPTPRRGPPGRRWRRRSRRTRPSRRRRRRRTGHGAGASRPGRGRRRRAWRRHRPAPRATSAVATGAGCRCRRTAGAPSTAGRAAG